MSETLHSPSKFASHSGLFWTEPKMARLMPRRSRTFTTASSVWSPHSHSSPQLPRAENGQHSSSGIERVHVDQGSDEPPRVPAAPAEAQLLHGIDYDGDPDLARRLRSVSRALIIDR